MLCRIFSYSLFFTQSSQQNTCECQLLGLIHTSTLKEQYSSHTNLTLPYFICRRNKGLFQGYANVHAYIISAVLKVSTECSFLRLWIFIYTGSIFCQQPLIPWAVRMVATSWHQNKIIAIANDKLNLYSKPNTKTVLKLGETCNTARSNIIWNAAVK